MIEKLNEYILNYDLNENKILAKHKNNKGKIYGLIDPRDNAIKYIGQTIQTLRTRLSDHINDRNLRKNTKKNNWIKKLKKNNLPIRIYLIEYCDISKLDEREIYWIATLRNQRANLKNGTDGGQGVRNYTDEMRAAVSLRMKGVPKTEQMKATLSKSLKIFYQFNKQPTNPMKGKKHTEETKKKISEKATGRKNSPEACEKMKGRIPWNKGKHQKKDGKPVLHFDANGIFQKEYDSLKSAKAELKISDWVACASANNLVKISYPFGCLKFKIKN